MVKLTYLNGKKARAQKVKVIYGRESEAVYEKETIRIADNGVVVKRGDAIRRISKDIIRVVKIKKNNKWTSYDYIGLWARKEK